MRACNQARFALGAFQALPSPEGGQDYGTFFTLQDSVFPLSTQESNLRQIAFKAIALPAELVVWSAACTVRLLPSLLSCGIQHAT